MKKIRKILIANRGEIACRIIATCKEMGIQTVSVYAEDEKDLPHVFLADQAYCLGEGAIVGTYLNGAKVIEAATKLGADAIHPGYGFLSEKADFAKLVRDSGLIFIGPGPEVMQLMGDKKDSKVKMQEWGIPLVPGYHGNEQGAEFLRQEGKKIGYPLLIKAAAGGGGKGMRIIAEDKDFAEGLEGAKSESMKAFKDNRVILEKYIINPRHIEVQVFSDSHGNHVHLFERECSIQRRHQKIVEETPSTALTAELRKKMTQTAVEIITRAKYLGAGTIEFILDQQGDFYFLEMNTRLQVEHPITEMITGLDLVKWQILVAQGEKLPLKQEQIVSKGHALEVRLYAEDADHGFLPSTGKIHFLGRPSSARVRFDVGLIAGNSVGIFYDPMLAKLIVWSLTRAECIEKMVKALQEICFLGVKNNADYLRRVLSLEAFHRGETYTNFVQVHEAKLKLQELPTDEMAEVVAGFLFAQNTAGESQASSRSRGNAGTELPGWRNC